MKKICAIVTISGLCLLAAAGIWALSTNTGSYSAKNQSVNSGETATFPKTTITDSISQHSVSPEKTGFTKHSTDDQPKILIAYFTWADNTTVTDSDAAIAGALRHYQAMGDAGRYSETDAVSSASLIPPGNTAVVAGFIRDAVGCFPYKWRSPIPLTTTNALIKRRKKKPETADLPWQTEWKT